VVRKTTIVAPTDVTVLRATTRPVLTLITCYPFAYIGHAPKRFIVRAERVSSARDGATAGAALDGTVITIDDNANRKVHGRTVLSDAVVKGRGVAELGR
jgi:hypothetical protein